MPKLMKKFELAKVMKSKNKKKVALAYAKTGIPIFPVFGIDDDLKCLCGNNGCKNQGKHPITKEGFKAATTDLRQVKDWWRKYPEANIASPLVPGLVALDFDGTQGLRSSNKLGLKGLNTLKVETGKGFHLYVLADLKSQNNAMSGFDIKGGGKGGYIILPPSRHVSGVRYTWVGSSTQAQALPSEVHNSLASKRTVTINFEPKGKHVFSDGERNESLFKVACSLRRQSISTKASKAVLLNINDELCVPPLTKKEVATILKSSSRYDEAANDDFLDMSKIKTESVDWYWYPYLPRGCIVFLDGHPGRGKSYFTMFLAALCSRGGKLPFSKDRLPKGRVLILNAEDDPAKTMRPRLEKAGANLSPNIIHFQGRFKPLTQEGIQTLEAKIHSFKPDVIIIDPLLTYMGGGVDSNRFNEVTEFLTQIDELAREHNICVIGVRHMAKSGGEHALNKGLGSIGFVARARSVLHIGRSKDDPNVSGFAHVKSNWSELGNTLLFELVGGSKTEHPELKWLAVADYDADGLDPVQRVGRPNSEPNLMEILTELLYDGPMSSSAIQRAISARSINVSKSTLHRNLKEIAQADAKGPNAKWSLI